MTRKKNRSEIICVKITTGESQLEFNIPKDALGQQLFEQVVRTVGLREIWYFGIKYLDKNNKSVWLRLDKKVSSNKFFPDAKNEFFLKIKFYPEDVEKELIQLVTIRHLYIQIKNDILSSTMKCPAQKCMDLAAYACVAKFGPYSSRSFPANLPINRLIQDRETLNLTETECFERIISAYEELNEMSREEAMINYLKIAQSLESYGYETFSIQDKNGNSKNLRVDAFGIKISESNETRESGIKMSWSEVRKISFHDKKFEIVPVGASSKEISFSVEKTRIGHEIKYLCIGNHELFMRRRKPDSIEVQQMKLQATEERETQMEDRCLLKKERAQRLENDIKLQEVRRLLSSKEDECMAMSNKIHQLETKLKKESGPREKHADNNSQNQKKTIEKETSPHDISKSAKESKNSEKKKAQNGNSQAGKIQQTHLKQMVMRSISPRN